MKVRYFVEALHANVGLGESKTFAIRPEFLEKQGSTLSYMPLTINHAEIYIPKGSKATYGEWHTIKLDQGMNRVPLSPHARLLKYPDNKCLKFEYNSRTETLEGRIELTDYETIAMIDNGTINGVSVCFNQDTGVFYCLTLSTSGGGDPKARIIPGSREALS